MVKGEGLGFWLKRRCLFGVQKNQVFQSANLA